MIRLGNKHILITAMLLLALLFARSVSAVEEIPKVYLNDITVQQGSQSTLSLNIQNISNYSALEINIYYDSTKFTVTGATYGYLHNSLPAHEKSYNTEELGVVSYILAVTQDVSYDGALLHIYLSPKQDTPVGDYNVNVAVVGAFDSNQQSISVETQNSTVTVVEQPVYFNTITYYAQTSKTTVELGDTFTYKIYSYNMYNLSTSNFEVYYDRELFRLVDVHLGPSLTESNMLSEINDTTDGFINIAFATPTGLNNADPIFEATFEVIQNTQSIEQITFVPKNMYDSNLNPLGGNQTTQQITIQEVIATPDYPDITIESYIGPYDQSFEIYVTLEQLSNLAAGDFVISYNANEIIIDDVTPLYDSSYFIFNHQVDNNKITFSIISSEPIVTQTQLFKLTGHSVDQTVSTTSTISITGSDVVNTELKPIMLDYVNATINLREYFNVSFIDYDGTILQQEQLPSNALPIAPIVTPRTNTLFDSWDQVISEVTQDITYQATYTLIHENLVFDSVSATYDGTSQSVKVDGLPAGTTVQYTNNYQTNTGTYEVTAQVYLDGVFSTALTTTLNITQRIVPVVIEDVTIQELDDLPIWTYTIDNILPGDEIGLEIYSSDGYLEGIHTLTASITNTNYQLDITPGTLIVTPYPWIYGDVNYDDFVSIADAAIIQLYLAELESFTAMQLDISDINQDGDVTIEDIALLQLYLADLTTTWPVHVISVPNPIKQQNSLQLIDTSSFSFPDQTFTYNGTKQSLLVEGIIPEGIESITYTNCTRTTTGSQYGIISFKVQEGYQELPNMIAKLTIEKADITNITFKTLLIEYDGKDHTFELESYETQFGDLIIIETPLQTFRLPGTYTQELTFTSEHYNDVTIEVTLEIIKRITELEQEDITIEILSNNITFGHIENNRLMISIDGLTYENTSIIDQLLPNHTYEISIYLKETEFDQLSNVIFLEVTTYYSAVDFETSLQSIEEIRISDYELLIELKDIIEQLTPEDRNIAQNQLNVRVNEYNQLIQDIHLEMNSATEPEFSYHITQYYFLGMLFLPYRKKTDEAN